MTYRDKKYFCVLSLFSLHPCCCLTPSIPPYALSLWWISPKQIRDAEESLSRSHFSPSFLSPFFSFPLHPLCFFWSPFFLSLSLSLFWLDFLNYLPFLPLAYVDLILSHYDDLRFSFSCWPIKKQTTAASLAFPYIALSLIRWPLLCILHYKLDYKNCPSVLFLYSSIICLNMVVQQRWWYTHTCRMTLANATSCQTAISQCQPFMRPPTL